MSATMCLLNQGEHIFTTESVLDLDTEHQNSWQVDCLFADFVCN